MFIIRTKNELFHYLKTKKNIGFIPTMGALHEGHLSLISQSNAENDYTVCSIFVNPTQFNSATDFAKYPKTIEQDILLLYETNCDVLFLPDVVEIYPNGTNNLPYYELGYLDQVLEGEFRPGHYQGVCVVVHRLLLAVNPTILYLGEKDYQQCMVIKKMITLKNIPTQIKICPTLREESGLAKSSRNLRLSIASKEKAASIYFCLKTIRNQSGSHSFAELSNRARELLLQNSISTEYLALANVDDLSLLDDFDNNKKMILLFAGCIDEVRLIDNLAF